MYRDEPLVTQTLESINTLLEAAGYMYECTNKKDYVMLESTAKDMIGLVRSILPIAIKIKEEIPYISAPISCENIIYSIENIVKLAWTRSHRISSQIEFELIPIVQDFYYDFYFYTCVFGDYEKENRHYNEEYSLMTANHYINESVKTGIYKYDVTIAVLAYNKLEYTKLCIENILKYTPKEINYELILINNGSDDGTLEYFQSLAPTKIFSLKKNSLNIMTGAVSRIYEGRYHLTVSNDVVVTENYLYNLIKCIESDNKIAMIVPTTPNVSNHQTIPAEYSTLGEMHVFAKRHNISNPKLWEERIRLCNPITFCRSDILFSSNGVSSIDKYFIYGEFGDDALALRIRRAGYKMILAKDCYCYHFGSVTLKEAQVKESTLEKSRKLFIERYGIDAWSTGFCFEPKLVESFTVKSEEKINILGINSGFGSNPLKIKTLYKEAVNTKANLFFVTEDERYVPDLKAISDNVEFAQSETINAFKDITFDYILLEGNIESVIKKENNFNKLISRLDTGGTLAIYASNLREFEMLSKLNPEKIIDLNNSYWLIWKTRT